MMLMPMVYAMSSKWLVARTRLLATTMQMRLTMTAHARMLRKVTTAMAIAWPIPMAMACAMNLKLQDVPMQMRVTTIALQPMMMIHVSLHLAQVVRMQRLATMIQLQQLMMVLAPTLMKATTATAFA